MGSMPYPALQSMFDAMYPPGLQWYWRGDFFGQLPDRAIDEHLKYGAQLPTLHSTMQLYPVDGATRRVDRHETAFSYRDAKWSMVIVGVDPDPANAEKITAWTKDYWAALHPYSLGGAYVNFMMDEGIDRVKATYRDNYDRLVAIKRKYDPNNFFRINQNISPD
jgi:FAD/FMN-containing dehydrogenase